MVALTRTLINPIAHQLLTDQGAAVLVEQGDAEFDDGDPENGPGYGGHPDYDRYHSEYQDICLDWRGMSNSDVEPEPPDPPTNERPTWVMRPPPTPMSDETPVFVFSPLGQEVGCFLWPTKCLEQLKVINRSSSGNYLCWSSTNDLNGNMIIQK